VSRACLLLALVTGCGGTTLLPYGKFVVETHHRDFGSSCLTRSHSHLRGPDGELLLEPLSLWELSGNRRWAVAASERDPWMLHLLDLEAGRIRSKHELGAAPEELGQTLFTPLQWSPDRDHLLLERVESPRTRSLLLFSFEPTARVRTLFREEGVIASVHELPKAFWAPDGTGLAFLVSPGRRAAPTRLFHATFDGAPPREAGRAETPPNAVSIEWVNGKPRLN